MLRPPIAYPGKSRPASHVADIKAVLYFREADKVKVVSPERKPIRTIGLAPLTSMFWFGKSSERRFDDYRPEVHDSDGLLMYMDNGEVLWRPLVNPAKLSNQGLEVGHLLFETLATLAERQSVSPEGLTYSFTLRAAHYADGTLAREGVRQLECTEFYYEKNPYGVCLVSLPGGEVPEVSR